MSNSIHDNKTVSIISLDAADANAVSSVVMSLGYSADRFESVGEFFNVVELVSPSCVVLCAGIHFEPAIDFQTKLSEQSNCLASTILIAKIELRDAVKLMEKGALTVLPSPFDNTELAEYLQVAIRRDQESELLRNRVKELESYRASLSDRQLKILEMVAQGNSNRQIANWFDLSQRTIELERTRLMSAFHSGSLAQLVSKWTELRVLTGISHDQPITSPQVEFSANGKI